MQTTVQLMKTSTGWNVHYQSGPRAEVIRSLFGTDILPLPYTSEMSFADALAQFVRNTQGVVSSDAAGKVVLS
ncbi:MAG TPA: hypothetical protein VGG62_10630 [Terracidiphilus sp.]|jgi:hypothetical protein